MTANELFRQYMGMTHEERERFVTIFKQLYDAQQLSSKPMSLENRAQLKEKQEREEKIND